MAWIAAPDAQDTPVPPPQAVPPPVEPPLLATCQAVLQEVFGYRHFRGPQAAIVSHVSAGGDALVLMPTGGGKSLCYQVPAIVRQRAGQGVALVVSPLIALMHDQVGALLEAGVAAAYLNSSLSHDAAAEVELSKAIEAGLFAQKLLDEGRVAARGTHEELLRDSELYNEILGSQLVREPAGA